MNLIQLISLIIILIAINFLWDMKNQTPNTSISQQQNETHQNNQKKKGGLKPGMKIFLSIVLAFPLIMGALFVNQWFSGYNKSVATKDWKEVTGIVKEKTIMVSKTGGLDNRGSSTTLLNFKPRIVYTYTEGDRKRTYDTIDYFNKPLHSEESKVQAILDKYPDVKSSIPLYISPDKKNAVLHKGISNMNYWGIILASVFMLIGLAGLKAIWL